MEFVALEGCYCFPFSNDNNPLCEFGVARNSLDMQFETSGDVMVSCHAIQNTILQYSNDYVGSNSVDHLNFT